MRCFQPLICISGRERDTMTIETIISQAGIPIILFVICMYYGLRLVITMDISLIRSERLKPLKDEKEYARRSGILILFYAVGTLFMAVLVFVDVYAAVAEIVLWTIALGIGWKVMTDQFEM